MAPASLQSMSNALNALADYTEDLANLHDVAFRQNMAHGLNDLSIEIVALAGQNSRFVPILFQVIE